MSVPFEGSLLYDVLPVADDYHWDARIESDAGLVALARTGQYSAFEELVRRYRNDVYALAFHYLRQREDAWDASQEVFIRAHRALGRFRGDASFKTWILRITANCCKDLFKKRRISTVSLEELGGDVGAYTERDPSSELESRELGSAIDTALAGLPHKHRTAFVLREFEGLSYQQMAEVMGCTMGTVMSRLHHARKKLQRALIGMGVIEDN